MGLFGFGKKKEEKSCCCGNIDCNAIKSAKSIKDSLGIKILGSGCAKCNELEENIVSALNELGLSLPVEHVTEFEKIAAYGVMTTPALVVNGRVVSYGKVLKKDEALEILKKLK